MALRQFFNKNNFKSHFLLNGILKDYPGMLIYNPPRIFNSENVKVRISFMFRENIKKLYEDTVRKIGKSKTDELWYISGKDTSFRYLSRHKKLDNLKINKKLFFKEIEKISRIFLGMHQIGKININFEKDFFVFYFKKGNKDKNKENTRSYVSGIISGILSYLLKKNIEAKFFVEDKKFDERIVADKFFNKIYEPNKELIKKTPFYPTNSLENKRITSGLYRFSDFIKFKIIKICKGGGIILNNKVLVPSESSIPTVFLKNYELIGESNLFKKSLIESSEKVCRDILSKSKMAKEKIETIRNIMSALGLGEVYFKKELNIITATFLKKIFILENPAFVHLFVNGFLNYLYGKKLTLIFESRDKFKYKI